MLQWVLLFIGIVIVLSVYAYTRYQSRGEDKKDNHDHHIDMQSLSDSEPSHHIETERLFPTLELEQDGNQTPQEETIFVLHVCAHDSEGWGGEKILKCALAAGLSCGNKNVFEYRFPPEGEEQSSVIFYVANFVNPGTFDWNNMLELKTKGLSVFMRLPVACLAKEALDEMLDCAKQLTDALGAELCDQDRQPLDKQQIKDMYAVCRKYDMQG